MTYYYLSFHPGPGCVITRCFDSAQERERFKRLVDCKTAFIQLWENTIIDAPRVLEV